MQRYLHALDFEARGANNPREPIGADPTSAASFGAQGGRSEIPLASGGLFVIRPDWLAAQPPVRGGYRAAKRRGRPRHMSSSSARCL